MANRTNKTLPSDWAQKKLISLQRELYATGTWPESADQLSRDLIRIGPETEFGLDETTFSIVVSDAIDGVDVSKRHSNFYRQMLQNPEFFQTFLILIDSLGSDKVGGLEPTPETEEALPDVVPEEPVPVLEGLTDGRWAVLWRQTMAQLNQIFSSRGSGLALELRSARGFLEESVAPLINSEAVVGERNLGVRLSAVFADDSDTLNLRLTVALLDEAPGDFAVEVLQAGISWGPYREIQQINEFGQAFFPPVSIQSITDEAREVIINDLQLRIQSNT